MSIRDDTTASAFAVVYVDTSLDGAGTHSKIIMRAFSITGTHLKTVFVNPSNLPNRVIKLTNAMISYRNTN